MRFSIFNVPLQRRLQTLVTLYVVGNGFVVTLLAFYLLCQNRWPGVQYLMMGYMLWIFFIDNAPTKGGRPVRWYQNLSVWNYFRDYFPAKLIVTKKLNPKKKYVMCLHPHGIIGMSYWPTLFMGCENAKQRLGIDFRICTVSVSFLIPIWREIVMAFGFIDAGKNSFNYVLENGLSVCVVVGGAREALLAKPGKISLTLKRRKGFVKYALQHGASLVPVFSFGENDLYKTITFPEDSFGKNLQNKAMKLYGVSTPLCMGRGIFNLDLGILPHRTTCYTVVGEPLDLPCIKDPKSEDIEKWHKLYVDALISLYENHQSECGYEGIELGITE
jgi:hypothetical protein